MEIVKDIGAIIGLILSIISLCAICTKGGRNVIKNAFKRQTQDLYSENAQQNSDIKEIRDTMNLVLQKVEILEEVSKQQCRDTLKTIYYKYYNTKKIPLYERKTADRAYEIYHQKYNGNSYATLLYTEICKWEIDTLSYADYDES